GQNGYHWSGRAANKPQATNTGRTRTISSFRESTGLIFSSECSLHEQHHTARYRACLQLSAHRGTTYPCADPGLHAGREVAADGAVLRTSTERLVAHHG